MVAAAAIPERIEKLRFLVEDMELAFVLSRWAPGAWEGRLIARQVLIRAKDFIAHARALRTHLKTYGPAGDFHSRKEAYAAWFDEYFATTRDRLGAHLQDLDFGRRIEIWNDIETSKVHVFVEGAREIYEHLGGFSLPGYAPLQPVVELADASFKAKLEAFRNSNADGRPEVGADPLAITRPQTIATINNHPIHARAGQLSLIARWIARQRQELERFADHPRVVRLLRSRLLTDVVSFADCLITRAVSANAPQALKGLNDLLAEDGHPAQALASLLKDYRFELAIGRLRPTRDKFGAHLELDPAMSLDMLLGQIDALDWRRIAGVFDTLNGAFRAACGEVIFLSPYLADGARLNGVIATTAQSPVAYDPAAPAFPHPAPPLPVRQRTEEAYRSALRDWLGGEEEQREIAAAFFYEGFSAIDGEPFRLEHQLPGGWRSDAHVFTQAHQVILDALIATQGSNLCVGVLALLTRQGHGYPARAAEVVLRFAEAIPASKMPRAVLCAVLAELAEWDAPRHEAFLTNNAGSRWDWPTRRAALLGLFKAFVRSVGIRRINHHPCAIEYAKDFAPNFSGLTQNRELELLIAMGSAFCDPLGIYRKAFADDLEIMQARIEELSRAVLKRQTRSDQAGLVKQLLSSDDYVGLVLLLAGEPLTATSRVLLSLVQDGTILAARHDQSGRHLVGCLWRLHDGEGALRVSTRLAERHPTDPSYQLLALGIQVELHRDLDGARDAARWLRADFVLTADDTAQLDKIEAHLASAPA